MRDASTAGIPGTPSSGSRSACRTFLGLAACLFPCFPPAFAEHPGRAAIAWESPLPYGTFSSPRLIESAGKPELLMAFGSEDSLAGGVVAVDAASGEHRWRVDTEQELFALPQPLTPADSGVHPWVVAGRNGQLRAIDAARGAVLWRFRPFGGDGKKQGIYNFYTGFELGDADGDGIRDWVVTNGGDSALGKYEGRPPGHLMVVSGRDGSVIHRMLVPDNRETYCSPLLWRRMDAEWVVFGTGGETFPGSLWAVAAEEVLAGGLAGIRSLVDFVEYKGAIAPPSLADLDGDGVLDLVAVPFDGRIIALSGRTLAPLWSFEAPVDEETQSSPAIGDFDGDGDLDVVQVEQEGIFPQWTASVIRVFDGGTGAQLWERRMVRDLLPASPLAVDLDADGRDEILITQSDAGLFRGATSRSRMQAVHVEEARIDTLAETDGFNSGAGLVADADRDGLLEWFVPLRQAGERGSLVRIDLKAPVPGRIAWGGYLGTRHDGAY